MGQCNADDFCRSANDTSRVPRSRDQKDFEGGQACADLLSWAIGPVKLDSELSRE